jgi:hypothetical protein
MNYEDLSPELREKAHACQSVEELQQLLKEEGMEIPDEELEGISGGAWCDRFSFFCPTDICIRYKPVSNCKG